MELIKDGRKTADVSSGVRLDTTTGANVGAQTIQRTAQMAMPIMDRLNQFSGKMIQQGTQKMVSNAKKQAVVDVESGDFSEYGLHDNSSVYAMAYDGAAETAYISQTNTQIQSQAKKIAAQNKYNPQGFITAWEQQKKEISKSSKKISPYIDAVTADVAQRYGDAAYTQIAGTLATMQFELSKKENSQALALYENEFTAAKLRGDEEAAMTALINRNSTLSSMKQTLQISDRGIAATNALFEKSVIASQVKSNFATAMGTGKSSDFIMNFRDTAKKDANFAKFTPIEIQGMIDDMHKTLKGENSFAADLIKQEKLEKEVLHDDIVNTFDNAWLTGSLTQADVDLALKEDTISQAEYKFYSLKIHDTGAAFTNTGTELNLVQNLASLSAQDIMDLPDITNADKMQYIQKLKTYQESEGGKWTSTVQGRASLQMLKTKYNIVGAEMMSKYTKKTDIAAYGKLYQSFILEMEKLPPEQRESRAMHYAQAAIDVQEVGKIENKKSLDEVKRTAKRNKIIERTQAYQKRIGKKKSDVYMQGLAEFQDDFGVTDTINFRRKQW